MTDASGATYRSLTHRNSRRMPSSKNRTGETTFVTRSTREGTSAAGPSTHARTARP